MLGTNDEKILALSKDLFPDFTDFYRGRFQGSGLQLFVPAEETINIRIVKEGYYYLSSTFKISEDMEKEALLHRVGTEVRKDGGNRGRIE